MIQNSEPKSKSPLHVTLSERVRRVSRRVPTSSSALFYEVRALFPVGILRLRDPSGRSAQDDYWGFLQEAL